MTKDSKQAKKLIDEANKVLIISHRKPDGDTLGAAISLRIWLAKLKKKVTLACVDKPAKPFLFLPYVNEYVDHFDLSEYDLMIVVDAGASYMTDFHKKYENLFKSGLPILNIDHHASNDFFGKVNIVDPEAASATVIICGLFEDWGVEADADMATCLLTGIYNDTGGFMHSNTSQYIYKIAADLMAKGAHVADISQSMFNTKSVSTLKLWGKVLESACMTGESVVMSVVRDQDYDEVGAVPDQLSGVIDYLNMVPGTKFALLINEDRHGNVKGSMRTRKDDVDLSRIAAVFGGGGHPKASGFMMSGKLKEEVRYSLVSDNMSKKSLKF